MLWALANVVSNFVGYVINQYQKYVFLYSFQKAFSKDKLINKLAKKSEIISLLPLKLYSKVLSGNGFLELKVDHKIVLARGLSGRPQTSKTESFATIVHG